MPGSGDGRTESLDRPTDRGKVFKGNRGPASALARQPMPAADHQHHAGDGHPQDEHRIGREVALRHGSGHRQVEQKNGQDEKAQPLKSQAHVALLFYLNSPSRRRAQQY